MVEPVSLAASAVALLVPYLERVAGRVAEQATDALADAAIPALKRLYEAVKARLRPGTYAGNQLQGVEERPDSEGRQQALRSALAEEVESDPAFAAELDRLVSQAQTATGVRVTATDVGVIAGRDAHLRGGYVAGRDMDLSGGIPPKQPSPPPDEH
jgi:murein L,D-transpeptidase YcbB/YkuD